VTKWLRLHLCAHSPVCSFSPSTGRPDSPFRRLYGFQRTLRIMAGLPGRCPWPASPTLSADVARAAWLKQRSVLPQKGSRCPDAPGSDVILILDRLERDLPPTRMAPRLGRRMVLINPVCFPLCSRREPGKHPAWKLGILDGRAHGSQSPPFRGSTRGSRYPSSGPFPARPTREMELLLVARDRLLLDAHHEMIGLLEAPHEGWHHLRRRTRPKAATTRTSRGCVGDPRSSPSGRCLEVPSSVDCRPRPCRAFPRGPGTRTS